MIGEKVDVAQPGGFEPARNQSPVRPNDSFRDRNLISQTRGYSSVSELSSSDDAGNHWVGEASIPMTVQHQCLAPTAIPASSFLYRTSTFRIAVLRGPWVESNGPVRTWEQSQNGARYAYHAHLGLDALP